MENSKKTYNKMPALITYIVAVVFLIGGLIFPIGIDTFTQGMDFGKMPAMQVVSALHSLNILPVSPFGELTPEYSFPVVLGGVSVDFGAIFLLVYAVVTVAAIALLVPSCIAKKDGKAAKIMIKTGELLALFTLLVMTAFEFAKTTGNLNLSVIVPFFVTLAMFAVPCILEMGKSGVMKLVLFLLSFISLLCLTDITANLGFLAGPLDGFAGVIKGTAPFETTGGLYYLAGKVFYGATVVAEFAKDPSSLLAGFDTGMMMVNIFALALVLLVFVNLFMDMFGMAKKTNKAMLISNIVRYFIQLALLVALAVAIFTLLGSFGLLWYFILLITFAQLIIQCIRLAHYKSGDKETEEKKAEDAEPAAEAAPAAAGATAETAAPAPAPQPAEAGAMPAQSMLYNLNPIYNGPTDGFINKLTNEQKIEFAQIFLERRSGNLSGIPGYIVGGDNSRFFSFVFIYLARVRELVTDGLMSKMYDEVNQLST